MPKSLEDRFLDKISPEPNTGCWIWIGSADALGYGYMKGGGQNLAHRVAYGLYKGKIPTGLVIDHLCRSAWCVNPQHLEAVSQGENVRRGKCSGSKGITHCPLGHEYTSDNSYFPPGRTSAMCRECDRQRNHIRQITSKKYRDRCNATRRRRRAKGAKN